MKRYILLTLSIALLIIGCSSNNNIDLAIKSIKNVKEKYAPDQRVALFNIKTKESNNKLILIGETNLADAKKELLDSLSKSNVNYVDSVTLLPSNELGNKNYAVVKLSVVNLRSKPNHRAEMVTQALLGTIVKVLKEESGFFLVQTPDKYIAWVDDEALHLMNAFEIKDYEDKQKIFYTNEYGFSYSDKSKNANSVSDLVIGDILILVNTHQRFYEVEYPDGRVAFVSKQEAELFSKWLTDSKPNVESILATANKFLGVPYLWGGTSSKGLDCSGFTKTVHFLNGIVLPRDASQQVNVGELIDTDDTLEYLKPGDLLFFGRKKSKDKKERITHVGIYIGNSEFIHASGRVKINSFDPKAKNYHKHYREILVRARRILSSIGSEGIILIKDHNFYTGVIDETK